jgi:hypothetical protein
MTAVGSYYFSVMNGNITLTSNMFTVLDTQNVTVDILSPTPDQSVVYGYVVSITTTGLNGLGVKLGSVQLGTIVNNVFAWNVT